MKIEPCPFCECQMEPFGDTVDRVSGLVIKQIRHPFLDNGCPLTILVFKIEQWNNRPVIQSAIAREREECAKIADDMRMVANSDILNPDLDKFDKEHYASRAQAANRLALQIRARSQSAPLTETIFPASILTTEDPRQTESDMLASVGIRMQSDGPECENKAPESPEEALTQAWAYTNEKGSL